MNDCLKISYFLGSNMHIYHHMASPDGTKERSPMYGRPSMTRAPHFCMMAERQASRPPRVMRTLRRTLKPRAASTRDRTCLARAPPTTHKTCSLVFFFFGERYDIASTPVSEIVQGRRTRMRFAHNPFAYLPRWVQMPASVIGSMGTLDETCGSLKIQKRRRR